VVRAGVGPGRGMPSRSSARRLAPERPGRPRRVPATVTPIAPPCSPCAASVGVPSALALAVCAEKVAIGMPTPAGRRLVCVRALVAGRRLIQRSLRLAAPTGSGAWAFGGRRRRSAGRQARETANEAPHAPRVHTRTRRSAPGASAEASAALVVRTRPTVLAAHMTLGPLWLPRSPHASAQYERPGKAGEGRRRCDRADDVPGDPGGDEVVAHGG
jgi:hypothetical protein